MAQIGSLYTFSPNTIIRSTYMNSNFADIKSAYNAHDTATNGVHGVSSGAIVGTVAAQTMTNKDISSSFIGAVTPNWINNVGLTNSANVLTVTAADGTTISAANPAYIAHPTTAGLWSVAKITSPITINHGAHASYNMNLGGARNAQAGGSGGWSTVCPLWLYWCVLSGAVYLVVSDVPELTNMPSAESYIGDFVAAPTFPYQGNCFVAATITKADFVSLPLVQAGSIRATLSTANNWTVTAIENQDGFGRTNYGKSFTYPTGAMGAQSGFHSMQPGAGNNPQFTTDSVNYNIQGKVVNVDFLMDGDGGNDGSFANTFFLTLPYFAALNPSSVVHVGCLKIYYAGATTVNPASVSYFVNTSPTIIFWKTAATILLYSDFSAGGRHIYGSFGYLIS